LRRRPVGLPHRHYGFDGAGGRIRLLSVARRSGGRTQPVRPALSSGQPRWSTGFTLRATAPW
jgi:hypothetical protein